MKPPAEKRILIILFAICLALNFGLSLIGLSHSLREVHEFRQIQTALSARSILQDGWHWTYPLPLFGPPWSAPFEFPLYQLIAAGLSGLTGLALEPAGRLVALAFFYLCLPAIFLLQEYLPISPARRWLLPSLVLLSPAYLYYSRSFLIESTALCAALWFLLGFCRTLTRPGWVWGVTTVLAGILAGLVKSTTAAVFLVAAATFIGATLWRQYRSSATTRELLRTILHSGLLAAPAMAAAAVWTQYADRIKAANPLSEGLVSTRLNGFILGSVDQRVDPSFWLKISQHSSVAILNSLNAVMLALLGLILTRHRRGPLLILLLCFLSGPLLFPNLYAVHDYYFYASGVFALAALALTWSQVLDLTVFPALARYAVVMLSLAVQLGAYWVTYRQAQWRPLNVAPELGKVLQKVTRPDDVVVILGQDWNPLLAYYAERRAVMLLESQQKETNRLEAVLDHLAPGQVGALVLTGEMRQFPGLVEALTTKLSLSAAPILMSADTSLYLAKKNFTPATLLIKDMKLSEFTQSDAATESTRVPRRRFITVDLQGKRLEEFMHPLPEQMIHPFGASVYDLDGQLALDAHAPTDLIFDLPTGKQEVVIAFGVLAGAYTKGSRTEGVEFRVDLAGGDKPSQVLFHRLLRPYESTTDRGTLLATITLPPNARGKLWFRTLPGPSGNLSNDYGYWARIDIQ